MSDHDNDTCPHLVRASLLEAENARLKADVNELAAGLKLASEVGIKIADEVTRLKAEVERLRSSSFVTAVPVEQYERLVAGGELVLREWSMGNEKGANNYLKALVIWNAAKEGKQP